MHLLLVYAVTIKVVVVINAADHYQTACSLQLTLTPVNCLFNAVCQLLCLLFTDNTLQLTPVNCLVNVVDKLLCLQLTEYTLQLNTC